MITIYAPNNINDLYRLIPEDIANNDKNLLFIKYSEYELLLDALDKIHKRLDADDLDEWSLYALKDIAEKAIARIED